MVIKGDAKLKALIVSDNHGDLGSLVELIDLYKEEIDLWLHCGDSEFMETNELWNHFKTVRGNMDRDRSLPAYREEMLGNEKIVIVHGHQHYVGRTFDFLDEFAHSKEADLVFYGHTHIAKVDKINDRYFINPGSIVQPRGEFRKGSYAVYEQNENLRRIDFYDWNHNHISDLSMDLSE